MAQVKFAYGTKARYDALAQRHGHTVLHDRYVATV